MVVNQATCVKMSLALKIYHNLLQNKKLAKSFINLDTKKHDARCLKKIDYQTMKSKIGSPSLQH